MEKSLEEVCEDRIEVITLGNFDIKIRGDSIIDKLGRSYKILGLFKYFISFKGKKLLAETIIDHALEYNSSSNPKNVLRTQILRLRKILEEIRKEVKCDNTLFNIEFSNGYYVFNTCERCKMDYEIFEEKIFHANKLLSIDKLEAIQKYKEAVYMYKGEYMGEGSYGDWIIPIRNRYNRIYLQTIIKLIEHLKSEEDYSTIIEVCEIGISVQPFEEVLHIYYMEALLKIGQIKQAMSHYEYTTYKLYKDFGIKPSMAMKDIYRKIQIENEEKVVTDLFFIEKRLKDTDFKGAMYCDLEYFKFLYNLEKRKSDRNNTDTFIALITLDCIMDNKSEVELRQAKNVLKNILLKRLRKGDVFTFWNENQSIVMFSNLKETCLHKIEFRIERAFEEEVLCAQWNLRFRFNKILSNF